MPDLDLTTDHKALDDDLAARRYFRKFGRMTDLLTGVTGAMARDGGLSPQEADVISAYVAAIASTFRALSMKYLIAGRLKSGARHLTIDFHESGFPVFQEIVTLANDAAQAGTHLVSLPEAAALKDGMVKVIVGERRVPVELQYALSQRLYFERLTKGGLFLAQMHPQAQWLEDLASGRRKFLIHWAVYDSQMNVPVVYLLEAEDSGRRRALPKDEARWPALQAHLLAQSVGGLKLLTIAKGVDKDFEDIHPKRLRRLFLGPMYSSAYTLQTGPIRDVLQDARAGEGEDWALAWTVEELESERVEVEKGWFSASESEVFRLDPLSAAAESGATRVTRNLILPQRVYQALAEKDPEGFRPVVKYAVGKDGRVVRA